MTRRFLRLLIPRQSLRGFVVAGTAALFAACGGSGDAFDALSAASTSDASSGVTNGTAGDAMTVADARSELASFSRADGAGGSSTGIGGSANGGSGEGGSGGGAGASGGLGGSGMVVDAGREACVPSGPGVNLGRDVAVNSCGTATCQYNTSYCCAPRSAAAPSCQAGPYGGDKTACLNKGFVPITCDEKAKCQHSSVCCGMIGDGGDVAVVSCFEKVDCQAPNLLICGSDADCLINQRCVARNIYGEKLGVCEATVTCQ